MSERQRVGEVIEASTIDFVAQCYELYQSPPLGSLVKTMDAPVEIYGVVYYTSTGSLEPGRRPIARGRDDASEEAIYQESPQLVKLLRTEFSSLVVGYREAGRLYHHLPARPARIHGFVYQCPPDEVREFGQSFDFLSTLIGANLPVSAEEIISASLRQMSLVYTDPHAFLVDAGKELAVLLGGEFSRLKAILKRIS